MSILLPPGRLTLHDQAVYDAIRDDDRKAFQEHFPQMSVSQTHMAHTLALGIVYDSSPVLDELLKDGQPSTLDTRVRPDMQRQTIREAAALALEYQRDTWIKPLFNTLRGPVKGREVTALLKSLVIGGKEREVVTLVAQNLPYAEGLMRNDPLREAIIRNQRPLVTLLWRHLGLPHFPDWATHLVVDSLADTVDSDTRALVLSLSDDDGLLKTTLVNAAMKNHATGLGDWWTEVQRRGLTVPQSDSDFALIQATEQGADRSVAFLLNTLKPAADPRSENGRALQEAVAAHHEKIAKMLLPHVEVLPVCQAMVRRKRLASGGPLTPADNWAQVDLLARWASDEQRNILKERYKSRLRVTQAIERQEKGLSQFPLGTTRRARIRA